MAMTMTRKRGRPTGKQKTLEEKRSLGRQIQKAFADYNPTWGALAKQTGHSERYLKECYSLVRVLPPDNVRTTLGVNGTTTAETVTADEKVKVPFSTPEEAAELLKAKCAAKAATAVAPEKVIVKASEQNNEYIRLRLMKAAIENPDKVDAYLEMVKLLDK